MGCLEKPDLQCYIPWWFTGKKITPQKKKKKKKLFQGRVETPLGFLNNCSVLLNTVCYSLPNFPGWGLKCRARQPAALLRSQAISGGRMDVHKKGSSGSALTVIASKREAPLSIPCSKAVSGEWEELRGLGWAWEPFLMKQSLDWGSPLSLSAAGCMPRGSSAGWRTRKHVKREE